MFESTGGLQYIIEKMSSELFLKNNKVDEFIHFQLCVFCIGFDIKHSFYDIYKSNSRLLQTTDKWGRHSLVEELKKLRQQFIEIAIKLVPKAKKNPKLVLQSVKVNENDTPQLSDYCKYCGKTCEHLVITIDTPLKDRQIQVIQCSNCKVISLR